MFIVFSYSDRFYLGFVLKLNDSIGLTTSIMNTVRIIKSSFLLIVILLVTGCSKDEDPVAAEKNAKLLAGNKNQSKTWVLLSLTEKVNSDPVQDLNFGACFFDNVYTFYNNANQEFDTIEGLTACNVDDPELIEEGNWAFSLNGNTLIISSDNVYSNQSLFSYFVGDAFPFPAEVITLTSTQLELRIVLEIGIDTVIYTFEFEAV